MGYEKRNIRVFLSSSMAEFRHEREAIRWELDERGIPNFVFEQEGASGDDPGTRFREAVQGASVYIGIFGKNCGAYTREEFNLARDNQIPCHLYVQDFAEKERSQELRDFLGSLQGVSDVPSLFTFSSTEKLSQQIINDLWKWVDRLVGKVQKHQTQNQQENRLDLDINDHLPILCDRDSQEIQFESQISAYFQQRSSRPLLLLLPGPLREEHGYYVKRVEFNSLKAWLSNAGISGNMSIKHVLRNPCDMTSTDHVRDAVVGLFKTKRDQDILNHMETKRIKALLLVVQILASECDGNPGNALHLLAEYWENFPEIPENDLVGMVVCLLDNHPAPDPKGFWQRLFSQSQTNRTRDGFFDQPIKQIQEQYQDRKKLMVEVLPPLTSPKEGDVRRWLEHDLVRNKVSFVRGKDIKAIFQGKDSLPMDVLYDSLLNLLNKQAG